MIDTGMIAAAAAPSEIIAAVERSWRRHVTHLKASIVRLPFPGEYTAIIGTTYTLIEGYAGPLLIDRVADGKTTHLLKRPLRVKDYRIFAYYKKTGQFQGFTTRPVVGFHYVDMNQDGDRKLCTGNLEYTPPNSIETVREICQQIIHSLHVIYLGSLGSIFLPYGYKGLKDAIKCHPNRQYLYMTPILEPKPNQEAL